MVTSVYFRINSTTITSVEVCSHSSFANIKDDILDKAGSIDPTILQSSLIFLYEEPLRLREIRYISQEDIDSEFFMPTIIKTETLITLRIAYPNAGMETSQGLFIKIP